MLLLFWKESELFLPQEIGGGANYTTLRAKKPTLRNTFTFEIKVVFGLGGYVFRRSADCDIDTHSSVKIDLESCALDVMSTQFEDIPGFLEITDVISETTESLISGRVRNRSSKDLAWRLATRGSSRRMWLSKRRR